MSRKNAMEPLVLVYGEAVPTRVLDDVVDRERPVIWTDRNGSFREMVSQAWMTRHDVHYYQRALPYQQQMDLVALDDRQATEHERQRLRDLYARMATQLLTLEAADLAAAWAAFLREKQALWDTPVAV